MSVANLPPPPPGLKMRPFRVVVPDLASPEFDAIGAHDHDLVICVGPFDGIARAEQSGFDEAFVRHQLEPRGFADKGKYFCSAGQGRYVMLWRVSEGRPRKRGPGARVHWDHPPRKLAHWDGLEPGVAMMLCPQPDDDAIDGAISRAGRMRVQRRGHFQPFFDDAGALWVAKLPDES